MKIYLIGMPGSGKTTLGNQLASELSLDFVDLDHEIETREELSIPEIFNTKGEDHFRIVESALLREWAASPKDFVMATGGGAPCFYHGIDVINSSGVSIFLNVPIQQLIERVQTKSNRPLLNDERPEVISAKLEKLIEQRTPTYKKAKITVDSPTLNSVLEKLNLRK